jgi:hypothetical protein
MEAFACVPAPLALKAVTTHRTPHSRPFWTRPLLTVRQPGTGRIMECGEASPLWLPRGAGRQAQGPVQHGTLLTVLEQAAFHRAPAWEQGGLWSAARRRRFGFPAERGDRPNAPLSTASRSTILPVLEGAALDRAPAWEQGGLWSAARRRRFGFPAERGDRPNAPFSTARSSPFWSRPLFTVRQPGNREDYGVRRDVAALASPRSGETGPTPRSARRPLTGCGQR